MNMGEDSERGARQTGGGVGWQNIWRLTAGMCRNQGMNNWKGDIERDWDREKERDREQTETGGEMALGQSFPISLLELFVSSIDQIKFLLPVYSTRVSSIPRSTPSLSCPPLNTLVLSLWLCHLSRCFLFYRCEIYAFNSRPSRRVCECSGQIKVNSSFDVFINETSTAISNFMAMNPRGFSQQIERVLSEGLERGINISGLACIKRVPWHIIWLTGNCVIKDTSYLQERECRVQ